MITYLFSMRKKSCFLSTHVPLVLKLENDIVTSPSWLLNQFARQFAGNEQFPSADTATNIITDKSVHSLLRRLKT